MQMLAKQLKDCQERDDISASIGLENDDDLFVWNVVFEGPENTLYEGGYFKAQPPFPDCCRRDGEQQPGFVFSLV